MPFKIVRNDITKMNTEAVVNTANEAPNVGMGCDLAIYKAAGLETDGHGIAFSVPVSDVAGLKFE